MKRFILLITAVLLLLASLVASDVTLNVYKTNRTVERFTLGNIDSVGIDPDRNLFLVYNQDGGFIAINMSEIDSINYSEGDYSLPVVKTVSAGFDFRLGKGLCEANISSDGGCEILERGICWSTEMDPTIADSKHASGTAPGDYYGVMDGLSSGETYYVRAYATNCMGTVYGEPVEVGTMMGHVTYTLDLDREQYPEYYSLLETALDSACYYYSRYTSFRANIYVYYNAGIPTAQASYHGSIGFGPSTSYMWVGTTMHEMAHYFGSGTTNIWKSLMVNGVWQGTVAQALCQELAGTTLKGDNNSNPIHFWPFGINYRSEVQSATDLINHAKIVQAMLVEDCGLPTSW
ncbi:MAG: hypothetical protein JXR52_02400 [Bacteroidales bacterium]|nr:hypothetical protein [Bacteroidales bacterium]